MKRGFSALAVLLLSIVSLITPPTFAQLVVGHKLTTGQVIVGVTGSAPIANTMTGTANQVAIAQGAEGGNMVFSFPADVHMTNLTVSGTLSPFTTGTLTTAGGLVVTYGVNTATEVITNTGATALTVSGGITAGTGVVGIVDTTGKIPALSSTYLSSLSGASLTTLTAANIATGNLANTVVASSIALTTNITAASLTLQGVIYDNSSASIRGTILPAKAGGQVFDSVGLDVCLSTGSDVNSWVKLAAPSTPCAH